MKSKKKNDAWIDGEILTERFFVEIKKFVEQVHEGKTGILSWLFFCKYFKDFQLTKKPLQLALAIKEHPCVLDHPTVRLQVIAWALQSKYPNKEDKASLKEFALGLGDYHLNKKSKNSIPFSKEHISGTYKYIYKMLSDMRKELKPRSVEERNFALRTLFHPGKARIIPLESKIDEWSKIRNLRELTLNITQYFLSYKWSLEFKNDFVKNEDHLLVPPKLIPMKTIEKLIS
jgi:hypothetical protein|tara:strand:+ start:8782 stop:9474 length:693 start_codon:yes stop_codon:yes gene_type:complete